MSTSEGERSPKRQRLESYSPASPPLSDTNAFVRRPPHTPPPSVSMSPTWQGQPHNNPLSQSQTGGTAHVGLPTTPSTSGFQSQVTARSASSENGEESGQTSPATENENDLRRDGDGDEKMGDQQNGSERFGVASNKEHRRTNHERQEASDDQNALFSAPKTLSKLATDPIVPSEPHPSQNLIELYDLRDIQRTVRRRDSFGQKVNKLRKSYEGKVKALGLEGKNKAQPNQKELEGLVDPGWDQMTPDGQSWWEANHQETLLGNEGTMNDMFAKLDSALKMEPGQLPQREHQHWKSLLGLDDPTVKGAVAAASPLSATAPGLSPLSTNLLARTGPGAVMRNSSPASPRAVGGRPERTSKKRRYDESTYAGYQEGYEDDGYSTSGVDDTGRRGSSAAKRQKRKDYSSSANSPPYSAGTNSGGSMVGVRSS